MILINENHVVVNAAVEQLDTNTELFLQKASSCMEAVDGKTGGCEFCAKVFVRCVADI